MVSNEKAGDLGVKLALMIGILDRISEEELLKTDEGANAYINFAPVIDPHLSLEDDIKHEQYGLELSKAIRELKAVIQKGRTEGIFTF